MLARQVVVPVAVGELGVALARHVGRRVAQRVDEAEADDVAGVAIARHDRAEIGTGGLDALRDQARRVEQRAVPVEDDQIEAAGRHGTQFLRAAGAAAARKGSARSIRA